MSFETWAAIPDITGMPTLDDALTPHSSILSFLRMAASACWGGMLYVVDLLPSIAFD